MFIVDEIIDKGMINIIPKDSRVFRLNEYEDFEKEISKIKIYLSQDKIGDNINN